MRRKYSEFIVVSTELDKDGRYRVAGRCGDYPIRVDDHLDALFRYQPRQLPDQAGMNPVLDVCKPADIRVVAVEAYGRSLPELGEGMTGILVLSGHGLEAVEPHWILGQRDRNPALTPHAHVYWASQGHLMLVLQRLPHGGFGVTSPYHPQLHVQAATIEEAFKNAHAELRVSSGSLEDPGASDQDDSRSNPERSRDAEPVRAAVPLRS